MTRNKSLLINALMVFSLLSPRAFAEDGKFTNKDFLKLPEAHQKFWIQGAMYALGSVAARKNEAHGRCVMNWYFGEQRPERNGLILASMKKYEDYRPSVIFVFLVEEACGKFYS